jgi:hypothetical protein
MRQTASYLPAAPAAEWRVANLILAWVDAADDAGDAYLAWRNADRAAHGDAFAVYQAALVREEAAASALQAASARRARCFR